VPSGEVLLWSSGSSPSGAIDEEARLLHVHLELEVEFAQIFKDMSRIVVSRTLGDTPDRAVVIGDDPAGRISTLKDQPGSDLLLICGPELRSTLAGLGLIDRYLVLVAPVVLGKGRLHFADAQDALRLRLAGTRVFGGGVVMLDYEPSLTA